MVIFQKPNAPILIAAVGFVLSVTTEGTFHSLGVTIYTIALIIWAYLEVASGANLFRKILGAAVLLFVAHSLFTQLR